MIPFSAMDYDGHFVDNITDERIDIEKIVEVKMQIEELNKALATLTKKRKRTDRSHFLQRRKSKGNR